MKLTRQTTTDVSENNNTRNHCFGRTHYFIIENATPAELEAVEALLTAAGWDNDGCPCYGDGFGCGYWVDIEEVDQFKADYKTAKKGVKAHLAAKAASVTVYAVVLSSGYDSEELQAIFSSEELACSYISGWLYPDRLRVVEYVVDSENV
ncbi:hypothetical protein EL09_22400 [Salmonella enterica subsp. enterica]|nr:hypothetical protein [Salmonella enterica subsp. enterica]MIF52423.1 hypothetical protein [Salmonella enterica subsp. enterica]